ncbi:ATP-dependent DNA helicase RecG [Rhizohabitans arisaemae]|uniref:ATP-dependent DNA helicase RecG n=1 Tax=Rhizohabitans arisaemae TaxID=2720610 RepID=UPI0024B21D8E|nr:ATP-dependent DNA helicase RecG [Rhizohabitans arisaemae]
MTTFDEPLTKVLGAPTAKKLDELLELRTVGDLMRHYPRRYAERGELTDLSKLERGEHVTVVAEVAQSRMRDMASRKGKLLEVVVTDGRDRLMLTFFGKAAHHHEKVLVPGKRAMFAGQVGEFNKKRQLTHPEYELLEAGSESAAVEAFAGAPVPVYPAAGGLPSWTIRKCVRLALDTLSVGDDPLPPGLRSGHSLIGLGEALELVHRPRDMRDVGRAQRRLKWDEAFVLQTVLAQRRLAAERWPATARAAQGDGMLAAFEERLPFTLTEGQREVGGVIAADLALTHPMHRLLQGEVGSGKTIVALRAMLQVVDAGGQAALLAPTEVLAQQHHRSIVELLGDLALGGMLGGTRVALLTGSANAASRRSALLDAASGAAGIVIGTHALLQQHVQFADLGLVVIDEQHRFGVEQRDALREKSTSGRPHVLVMTATPIPRTVAMTVYGDLDVVTLTQLPSGRMPIATHVVPAAEKPRFLDRTWSRVREEVGAGRQAYVVCPRIGDGDGEEGDPAAGSDEERRPPIAVSDLVPLLAAGPLAGLRIEALHGRMHPEEKDAVMRAFTEGAVDVLVATTVIEVGVNVPNASVMVVMDADRFGVSQLHQLRGRVGRGSLPGLCLLVTESPGGTAARARLDAVAATLDGFELSRIDLEQRREGDVLGAAQSGRKSALRMLRLLRDEDVIEEARVAASTLVAEDPKLAAHPALRTELGRLVNEERAEYLEKT